MIDYVNDYLGYLMFERRLPKNSYQAYIRDINAYVTYLNDELNISKINKVKRNDIVSYIEFLNKEELAFTSIARKLTAIKGFHAYLLLRNMISEDVSLNIERPKLKKRIPDVLTVEEVDSLLNIDLNTVFDYRNKAMLELLYGTGFRISELLDLQLGDIDFEDCIVRCFGKGSKERIVPIGEYILDSLRAYLEVRPQLEKNKKCEYLFLSNNGNRLDRTNFFRILKALIKIKGINKDISPHDLRHSFATHMIECGADLKVVQDLMGHADIATTRIYTHISNSKVKNDYNESHPRS